MTYYEYCMKKEAAENASYEELEKGITKVAEAIDDASLDEIACNFEDYINIVADIDMSIGYDETLKSYNITTENVAEYVYRYGIKKIEKLFKGV